LIPCTATCTPPFFEVPSEGPFKITEGVEVPAACQVEVATHNH
jgi:hypothetical protein